MVETEGGWLLATSLRLSPSSQPKVVALLYRKSSIVTAPSRHHSARASLLFGDRSRWWRAWLFDVTKAMVRIVKGEQTYVRSTASMFSYTESLTLFDGKCS